jgi:hypothetical protein
MVFGMGRVRWLWLIAAGIAALAFVFAACGDDDGGGDGASAEEIAAVEDVIRQTFGASGAESEYFFAHVTDNLISSVLFSTREDCMANADECIGEPVPPQSVTDTAIDGDTATSVATADFGTFEVGLIREEEVWKVDSLRAVSDDVPEGAAIVDLGLTEFAFTFDEAAIPADGNFGFHVTNDGEQAHEVGVASIDPDVDLMEAIAALGEDEEPVGFKLFIQPGQEVDMAFAAPLEPGRYAMVCFFPDTDDPEGTPHVEKGMVAEFTIE